MSEEIQDVVQIVKVTYEGVEIAMKLGGGSLGLVKAAFGLIKSVIDHEKALGKTSMKKLLLKGGDLQVFKFKTEDIKDFKKLAKKYGILYSILPDINKADGMSEVIFHSEAAPRINMIGAKLRDSGVISIDEYIKNGDPEEVKKLMANLEKKNLGEESKNLQELTERMKAVKRAKDPNLFDISLSKNLIIEETKEKIKTRVPGTWGEDIRFLWIDKEDVMDIHSGKTILSFLDKDKVYKLLDKNNKEVESIRGAILYDKHYDKVEAKLREKYESAKTISSKIKNNIKKR